MANGLHSSIGYAAHRKSEMGKGCDRLEINSLQLKNIYKFFNNIPAVSDISFTLNPGKVYSIIGENGAGKSTIVKIINGTYTPERGEIFVNGARVKFTSPADASASGIGMVYQELHLIPNLSVTENIFISQLTKNKAGIIDWKSLKREAKKYLELFNVDIDINAKVGDLKVAHQQIIAIIRAYAMNNRVLILDEPTSALPAKDIGMVIDVVKKLVKLDCIIIYISHKLDEVLNLSDWIIAMRNGEKIGEFPADSMTKDKLVELIAGRSIENKFPKKKFDRGEELLRFEHVTVPGYLEDISFSLHKGEILGFSGLLGAGKTEVAKTVFGVFGNDYTGSIWLNGKKLNTSAPRKVIGKKIGLVPENRAQEGLVLEHSVLDNISLASIGQNSTAGVMSKKSIRTKADHYVKELGIKCSDILLKVRQLSGGNQQKVVLSKWLMSGCDFIIFDEPTRGIDVGAKFEIYNLMNDLVERGVGVMIMSSEIDEVLGMADRTIILKDGKISCIVDSSEVTEEELLEMC